MNKISQLFYLAQWFVRARFFGRKAPLQTVLFITDLCNLRCKHCSIYNINNPRHRSFDDIVSDLRYSYKQGSRYPHGQRGLCTGYGTDQCRSCGFCMAGEMSSVFHFCPDTLLSGLNLRM